MRRFDQQTQAHRQLEKKKTFVSGRSLAFEVGIGVAVNSGNFTRAEHLFQRLRPAQIAFLLGLALAW